MADDDYLTTPEVAALLRCSVSLLTKDRDKRDDLPPYVRVGSRILYRRADIEAWADQQTGTGR
jgi:predicted DNA-binding transcriptional regulator AlpA